MIEKTQTTPRKIFKLNTSNLDKFQEFKRLFADHGYELIATHIDLKEADADPITVVTQKASQIEEGVIIEDTSLDINGASVGVNVRWLIEHLPDFVGKQATWVVLIAYRDGDTVRIYKGAVNGVIVNPRGKKGFGFDPVFLPDGAKKTLAQCKPDQFNARAKAVKALINQNPYIEKRTIDDWNGPWQNE